MCFIKKTALLIGVGIKQLVNSAIGSNNWRIGESVTDVCSVFTNNDLINTFLMLKLKVNLDMEHN